MPDDFPRSFLAPTTARLDQLAPGLIEGALALYWDSFARQILPLPIPRRAGIALLKAGLRPGHGLVALTADGQVAGVAGVRDGSGGIFGASRADFIRILGPLRGRVMAVGSRFRLPGPSSAEIILDGLAVRPDLRGQGYARALVFAALALALARGYPGLRAEVAPGNRAAHGLYRAIGFTPLGHSRIGWPWSGRAEVMRLAEPRAEALRSCPSPAPKG